MIRITTTTETSEALTIRIEGRLVGSWTELARRELARTRELGLDVRLDLAELRYADARGVSIIRDLLREGAVITRASGFISELLGWEQGE